MATFLLTWNPDGSGWPDADYADAAESFAAGRTSANRWSTALRKSGIAIGDRAFLMRQRHERGVVASGTFASEIYEDEHWERAGATTTYAQVTFDALLPIEDRLDVADLKALVPGVYWDRLQGSGVLVPAPHDQALEQAWSRQLSDTPYRTPGEYKPTTYEEGAVTRVEVNRYERDRAARAACIAHHGTTCVVCSFDFEAVYGRLGRDFIHVHHLKELSTLGPAYMVNPVRDLRPLCANCHAMAHRQRPALTPSQLRKRLRQVQRGEGAIADRPAL
jgi:5-methylcytosine-specific restriction protein A